MKRAIRAIAHLLLLVAFMLLGCLVGLRITDPPPTESVHCVNPSPQVCGR